MEALVMMLFNTKEQTYHPIMYTERPMPGSFDMQGNYNPGDVIRYKSLGHRTNGFKIEQEALDTIATECVQPLRDRMGYHVNLEVEDLLQWGGEGIPADVQIRPRVKQETV